MKLKSITILLALLLISPVVQAAEATLDTQYYGYLRDTCKKNNVERTWNRWFGDKQKDLNEDVCCMNAVAEMEKQQALTAEDGVCPAGLEKKSLDCPTSKQWCEKVQ
jgi:hypothetical protein